MANLISSHFHVSLEKASGPLGDAASKWQRYVNEITRFADAIIPPSVVGARNIWSKNKWSKTLADKIRLIFAVDKI